MSNSQFGDYFTNPNFVGGYNAIKEGKKEAFKKGMVYVEDDSDISLWKKFINQILPNKYNFTTATSSKGNKAEGKRVLEKMYPKRCPFCQEISSKGICDDCRKQVVKVGKIKCIHCGKPLEGETKEYCRDCERRKSNYEQGRSLWVHIPPVSNSVYRLKYHNKRYYAEIFGKELADEFEFQIRRWGIQAIIPIPLHRSKMRKRGYNQAELLAKQLSECMGIPMEKDVLYRIKKTRPLKEMNGEQRHRNLKGAFAVSKSWNPRQNILLIDDIYTTGNTIHRVAKVLKNAGAQKVYFLTISIGQGL